MNRLKQWLKREVDAAKAAREARHRAEIEYRFTIRERQGKIYILCNTTAIATLPPESTMQDALALMKKARTSAVAFDKVSNTTD